MTQLNFYSFYCASKQTALSDDYFEVKAANNFVSCTLFQQ